MPPQDSELAAFREQLQALGVEMLIPTRLVETLLGVSNMTLFRWRQKGIMPDPPVTNPNRYPLSWLYDLMATRTPGGKSTIVEGLRLALRLAKADGVRKQTLSRLTKLGLPVLNALESGDLKANQEQLRALQMGLGLTLIDLYRLGRVAAALDGVRRAEAT